MYFSIFIFVLLILGFISLESINNISYDKKINELLTSSIGIYTTENSIEESLYEFKINKESEKYKKNTLIRSFQLEQNDYSQKSGKYEGDELDVNIVDRNFSETPNELVILNKEKKFDEFRFIEVHNENKFTEILFYYSLNKEENILFDIIGWERIYFEKNTNSEGINFGNIKDLSSSKGDKNMNIKRMMYFSNSENETQNSFGGIKIEKTHIENSEFKYLIKIKNLDTNAYNYIIRFQALKNEISFKIEVFNEGEKIDIPLTNQILEIDSLTSVENMYQRIKMQQKSFAPLQNGLGFVLFSDKEISK